MSAIKASQIEERDRVHVYPSVDNPVVEPFEVEVPRGYFSLKYNLRRPNQFYPFWPLPFKTNMYEVGIDVKLQLHMDQLGIPYVWVIRVWDEVRNRFDTDPGQIAWKNRTYRIWIRTESADDALVVKLAI